MPKRRLLFAIVLRREVPLPALALTVPLDVHNGQCPRLPRSRTRGVRDMDLRRHWALEAQRGCGVLGQVVGLVLVFLLLGRRWVVVLLLALLGYARWPRLRARTFTSGSSQACRQDSICGDAAGAAGAFAWTHENIRI